MNLSDMSMSDFAMILQEAKSRQQEGSAFTVTMQGVESLLANIDETLKAQSVKDDRASIESNYAAIVNGITAGFAKLKQPQAAPVTVNVSPTPIQVTGPQPLVTFVPSDKPDIKAVFEATVTQRDEVGRIVKLRFEQQ